MSDKIVPVPFLEEPLKVLFVYGTRPEAIKLAPLVCHLREQPDFAVEVCLTGQHRQMLDSVMEVFGIRPDYDLNAMLPGQTLFQSTARIVGLLEEVFQSAKPGLAIVQGDTTSTFCGALAAFYAGVPVGHVEAGLRTGDMRQPFPEEMNRVLTARLAALHFAPTSMAAEALRREGIAADGIAVTGNTGIDAVLWVAARLEAGDLKPARREPGAAGKRTVLVTAHRRESFGEGFVSICEAIGDLAGRGDVEVVYPVHPNPQVREPVRKLLAGRENIRLIDPLDYISFVDLMRRSYLLLTDSGGVQEEGPSLGKPVLVMREKTERPEAVEAGTARLTGTVRRRIVEEAARLLDDQAEYERRSRIHNPYGDGHASKRITAKVREALGAPMAEVLSR